MCTRNTHISARMSRTRGGKIYNLSKTATKKKKMKKIPTTPSNYIPLPSAHCFLFGVNGFRVRRTQYICIRVCVCAGRVYYIHMRICVCVRLYIPGAPVPPRRCETKRNIEGHGQRPSSAAAADCIPNNTHTHVYEHV